MPAMSRDATHELGPFQLALFVLSVVLLIGLGAEMLLDVPPEIAKLLGTLFGSRRKTGLASLLVSTFLVVSFASASILLVESSPESNIHTAEDALWWAMTTITTVGYGDLYPVTNAGRLIASLSMLFGIGLFGALSGIAASFFLGNGSGDKPDQE